MGKEDTRKKVREWFDRLDAEQRDIKAVLSFADWPHKEIVKKEDGTGIQQGYYYFEPRPDGAPAASGSRSQQRGPNEGAKLYKEDDSLNQHVEQTIMAFDTFVSEYIIYPEYLVSRLPECSLG